MWRATEEDSSDSLSLPLLVKRLRHEISRAWGKVVAWPDLVAEGQRLAQGDLGAFDPDPTDLPNQLRLLAACWLRANYPEAEAEASLAFGWLMADTACKARIDGGFDDRYLWARFAIGQEPNLRKMAPEMRIDRVLQIAAEIYLRTDLLDEPEEDAAPAPEIPPPDRAMLLAGNREPRLWSAREEESGVLSLPALVRKFRHNLSLRLAAPVTWADLIGIGKRMGFPVEQVDPFDTDLSGQLWLLASAWLKVLYDLRSNRDCIEFGRMVVYLGYRTPSIGRGTDDRFVTVYEKAFSKYTATKYESVPADTTVSFALDMLVYHYGNGR